MTNIEVYKEKINEDIKKHMDNVRKKIQEHISVEKSPDILILKSHLICEYYLNQILIVKELTTLRELDSLNFYKKANMVVDKKDSIKLLKKILKLNKLRNKIGHELEYKLSESDIDTIGYIEGKKYINNKYEINDIKMLLINILIEIIIETAMLLFNEITSDKIKNGTFVKN